MLALLHRMSLPRLLEELGNGRAVANARRGLDEHELAIAQVEVLARRVRTAPLPAHRRSAAA